MFNITGLWFICDIDKFDIMEHPMGNIIIIIIIIIIISACYHSSVIQAKIIQDKKGLSHNDELVV